MSPGEESLQGLLLGCIESVDAAVGALKVSLRERYPTSSRSSEPGPASNAASA